MAGLRDYNVMEWMELRETVVITYTGPNVDFVGQKMTLTYKQLKDKLVMKGKTLQHSRHATKPYYLWYYTWLPDESEL